METVYQKIGNKNPWYIDCHLDQVKDNSTRRVILKRWNFIISAINSFREKNKKNSLDILDAGCGDGVNLKILAGIPGAKVHGIDYNPVRLERVKREFPGVEIAQADITCFETDKKFDIVLCSQVLEHIKDDRKALENIRNLLRDSGILILGVPNEGCFLARLRNNVFEPAIRRTTDHVNFYTEHSIRRKIENAGFMIRERMYEGFFLPCQKLSSFFASSNSGFALLNLLNRLFKDQAGGYYFLCARGPL